MERPNFRNNFRVLSAVVTWFDRKTEELCTRLKTLRLADLFYWKRVLWEMNGGPEPGRVLVG